LEKDEVTMVKMTQSFRAWCLKYHSDIYSPLMFGHTEEFTEKLAREYGDWCRTDEGRQYLKGGSKYKEDEDE